MDKNLDFRFAIPKPPPGPLVELSAAETDLLNQHPELEYEFQEVAAACQKAVEAIAKKAAQMTPIVHRGWRKRAILVQARLRKWVTKLLRSFSRSGGSA